MNIELLQKMNNEAQQLIIDGIIFSLNSWAFEKESDTIIVFFGSTDNNPEIIVFEYTIDSLNNAELVGNMVFLKNRAGKDSIIKFKK